MSDNTKVIADLRALQSALYYGHELTGDEAPLLDLVIDILEQSRPPVQEGPKGCRIEAAHHFDDCTIAGSFTIPAQSIPAAIDEEKQQ